MLQIGNTPRNPRLKKGNSFVYRGQDFNEIELLFQVRKPRPVNQTVSRIDLYKLSPSRMNLREESLSEVEEAKRVNSELYSIDSQSLKNVIQNK